MKQKALVAAILVIIILLLLPNSPFNYKKLFNNSTKVTSVKATLESVASEKTINGVQPVFTLISDKTKARIVVHGDSNTLYFGYKKQPNGIYQKINDISVSKFKAGDKAVIYGKGNITNSSEFIASKIEVYAD